MSDDSTQGTTCRDCDTKHPAAESHRCGVEPAAITITLGGAWGGIHKGSPFTSAAVPVSPSRPPK